MIKVRFLNNQFKSLFHNKFLIKIKFNLSFRIVRFIKKTLINFKSLVIIFKLFFLKFQEFEKLNLKIKKKYQENISKESMRIFKNI